VELAFRSSCMLPTLMMVLFQPWRPSLRPLLNCKTSLYLMCFTLGFCFSSPRDSRKRNIHYQTANRKGNCVDDWRSKVDWSEARKKAAHTRKWRNAQKKSVIVAKNAMTFTKVRLNELGWKYAEFQSKKKNPQTGIVDLVAVKCDRKD